MGRLRLPNGLHLAFQKWTPPALHPNIHEDNKIFCIHGWLDNSNSFSFLAPRFADMGYEVVAIDAIGHGWSDHIHSSSTYHYIDRCYLLNLSHFQFLCLINTVI
jgi:pimeloyl-ACP methyl ester carboxylesterase